MHHDGFEYRRTSVSRTCDRDCCDGSQWITCLRCAHWGNVRKCLWLASAVCLDHCINHVLHAWCLLLDGENCSETIRSASAAAGYIKEPENIIWTPDNIFIFGRTHDAVCLFNAIFKGNNGIKWNLG